VVEEEVEGVLEVGFGVPEVEFVRVVFHFNEAEECFKVFVFISVVIEALADEGDVLLVYGIHAAFCGPVDFFLGWGFKSVVGPWRFVFGGTDVGL
jgi:hypothetical protein